MHLLYINIMLRYLSIHEYICGEEQSVEGVERETGAGAGPYLSGDPSSVRAAV
jgi:hypothetical protein